MLSATLVFWFLISLMAKLSDSQGHCLSRPPRSRCSTPPREQPVHRQPPRLSDYEMEEGTSGDGWDWRAQVNRWALNAPRSNEPGRQYQTAFEIAWSRLGRIGRLSVEWEPWSRDPNRFAAIIDVNAREVADRFFDHTGHQLRSLDIDFYLVSALTPRTIIPPEFGYRPNRPDTALGHWHWEHSLPEPQRAYVDYRNPTEGLNNNIIFKWKITWRYYLE